MGEKGRIITGARARLSIDGIRVGYCRQVAFTESIDYEPVNVLDNIEVEEFAPVGYDVRGTAGFVRIVEETLKKNGFFPAVGGDSREHLENILVSKGLTLTVEDTKTSKIVTILEQVKITSHNWTFANRTISGEDIEFVAIRSKDESE